MESNCQNCKKILQQVFAIYAIMIGKLEALNYLKPQ